MADEIHPIQVKRRLIIDRIGFLKNLEWNDFVKQWVNDLHDELEEIDNGTDIESDLINLCEDNEVMKETIREYFNQ